MTDLATVSVPATSANLGPGYDVLGLALGLRLSATARPARQWKIATLGAGAGRLPTTGKNLMARAYRQICQRQAWSLGPLEIKVDNPIPIGRGLGSSAAAIVTGMALAQLLHQGRLDRELLFQEAAALEGHPDNVAPAVFGGLQRVTVLPGGVTASAQELADNVKVLLVIPHAGKSTARMREVVPREIAPLLQAANDESLKHVLEGLAQGDPKGLRYSAEDRRHQPYRLAVQPESAAILSRSCVTSTAITLAPISVPNIVAASPTGPCPNTASTSRPETSSFFSAWNEVLAPQARYAPTS